MAKKSRSNAAATVPISIPDGASRLAVQYVPYASIHPDPAQPRKDADDELRASIGQQGILQPITVRHVPGEPRQYFLVDGERRWRGAAGVLAEVPVIIRDDQDERAHRLVTQLVANTGKPLTPVEEARAYREILDGDETLTLEALATQLGRPRSSIGERLQLLALGPWLPLIEHGDVTISMAVQVLLPLRGVPESGHQAVIDALAKTFKFREIDPFEDPPFATTDDFDVQVRAHYKPFMYPLTKTKDGKTQPEFNTAGHDRECNCGGIKFALDWAGERKCCGNPEWWKPKLAAAKKAARADAATANKKPASSATSHGQRPLYLPEGAKEKTTTYASDIPKGYTAITDEQGHWRTKPRFIGDSDEGYLDPTAVEFAPASLMLLKCNYGGQYPVVATNDQAALKEARTRFQERLAPRLAKIRAAALDRIRDKSLPCQITGAGAGRLIAWLAADDAGTAIEILNLGDLLGFNPPQNTNPHGGQKKIAAWLAGLSGAQAAQLLTALTVQADPKEPGLTNRLHDARSALATELAKAALPWRTKPKAVKAAKQMAAAKATKPAKRGKGKIVVNAPQIPSPALAKIVGPGPLTTSEATIKVWKYVKEQALLDGSGRGAVILADKKLKPLFAGQASVSRTGLDALIRGALAPAAPAAPEAPAVRDTDTIDMFEGAETEDEASSEWDDDDEEELANVEG